MKIHSLLFWKLRGLLERVDLPFHLAVVPGHACPKSCWSHTSFYVSETKGECQLPFIIVFAAFLTA